MNLAGSRATICRLPSDSFPDAPAAAAVVPEVPTSTLGVTLFPPPIIHDEEGRSMSMCCRRLLCVPERHHNGPVAHEVPVHRRDHHDDDRGDGPGEAGVAAAIAVAIVGRGDDGRLGQLSIRVPGTEYFRAHPKHCLD